MLQALEQDKPMLWLEVRKEQLMAMERSTFSQEFILWMASRLKIAIVRRLEKRGDRKLIRLLDDLEMLWVHQIDLAKGRGQVSGLDDEDMIDIIGRMSYQFNWPPDTAEIEG